MPLRFRRAASAMVARRFAPLHWLETLRPSPPRWLFVGKGRFQQRPPLSRWSRSPAFALDGERHDSIPACSITRWSALPSATSFTNQNLGLIRRLASMPHLQAGAAPLLRYPARRTRPESRARTPNSVSDGERLATSVVPVVEVGDVHPAGRVAGSGPSASRWSRSRRPRRSPFPSHVAKSMMSLLLRRG